MDITWDGAFAAVPPDTGEKIRDLPSVERDTKTAVQERLGNDHYFDISGSGVQDDHGLHKQATFQAPLTGDPAHVANKAILYTKIVNSKIEVFCIDDAGNVMQLTSAGFSGAIPILPVNFTGTLQHNGNSVLSVPLSVTVLTTGSGTYTTPTGAVMLKVRMTAGGGGGASGATPTFNVGTNGVDTSFGSAVVAHGSGGTGALSGGVGGNTFTPTGMAYYFAVPGGNGGLPYNTESMGGAGGGSIYGGNGQSCSRTGGSANGWGSGGAGGSVASGAWGGGGGGAGLSLEGWFLGTLDATYAYVVGSGGTGGTAGGPGYAGGNGHDGIIIIEAY